MLTAGRPEHPLPSSVSRVVKDSGAPAAEGNPAVWGLIVMGSTLLGAVIVIGVPVILICVAAAH